jgi:hypothetical protein
LYNSTLLLLTATFTSTNFSPQIIFLYRPVLSYLTVATATWQHWRGAALCIGKICVNRSAAFGWEAGAGGQSWEKLILKGLKS